MCGPAMAIAAAVSAASAVGSSMAGRAAQNRVESAQQSAIKREAMRQKQLQLEARGRVDQSIARAQKPEQDALLNTALSQRTQAYTKATSPGTDYLPGASGNPDVIQNETSRAVASADASSAQQQGAKAKLDSYGDLAQGNSIDALHGMNLIQMLANFRQGSQAVLPYELNAAQRKGKGLRTLADILRGTSQIAGAAGGAMGGGAMGAAAGAVPGWLATGQGNGFGSSY